MNIITRQMLANKAAERWKATYKRMGRWETTTLGCSGKIHAALLALGKAPAPEAVDAAIGNDSWTNLTCSCCSQHRLERALYIDVTGGEYATRLCEKCVREGAGLFT